MEALYQLSIDCTYQPVFVAHLCWPLWDTKTVFQLTNKHSHLLDAVDPCHQ